MIIVPELQTVFILVPRTGSGSLYRELQRVYSRSMLLYRHMEADGVPHGYDRWRRVGFVRHPLMRLWSLYNFMRDFGGGAQVQGGAASADAVRVRAQVAACSFEEWLLTNDQPWTIPYDMSGQGDYWPVLARRNAAAENRLSQRQYLRPDLGTQVLKFENLKFHMAEWALDPNATHNQLPRTEPPHSAEIVNHIWRFCAWDMEQHCESI